MFPIFQTLPFFLFHFLILVTSIFHSFPSLIPFCPFLFTHSFLSIPFRPFLFVYSFSLIPFCPFLFVHSFSLIPFCLFLFTHSFLSIPVHPFHFLPFIFHSFSLISFCPFLFTHSFLSIPFCPFLFTHPFSLIPFCPFHFVHSFSLIPFLPFLFSHSFVLCQPSDILDSSRSTTAKKDEAFMMHINTSRKFDSPSSGRKTFATPDSKKSDSRCNDYYISIYMKYC